MPMVRAKIANLRRRLETLEANRKPIPIRPVLSPVRQMEGFAIYLLEGFEHRAVVLVEQSVRDMQSIVGIDPDQMGIEGGMMDFGERHAVRDDGLPELLVLIGNDVRGVEQPLFGQSGQGATPVIGRNNGFAERDYPLDVRGLGAYIECQEAMP